MDARVNLGLRFQTENKQLIGDTAWCSIVTEDKQSEIMEASRLMDMPSLPVGRPVSYVPPLLSERKVEEAAQLS